jgi:membrane protease YdiL (CAAX protease family)
MSTRPRFFGWLLFPEHDLDFAGASLQVPHQTRRQAPSYYVLYTRLCALLARFPTHGHFSGTPQLTVLGSFGPSVAALVTHRLATGSYRRFRFRTTWTRTLVTTVVAVALIILAYVVLPGISTADPHKLNWSILMSFGVYNYSTLFGRPLGEEPGWRGYALPRMEAALGAMRGSLLLGILWTGWHRPLFIRSGWESAPLWIYTLILIGLSVIMSYAAIWRASV